MDYIVFAPDYTENSAGVRCLYILADRLNKKGYRTFITGSTRTNPELVAPLIPMYVAKGLAQNTAVRVVYPETVTGNPLGAKVVIRWVLNRPGLLAGDRVYDPKEIVFNYSKAYTRYIENPVAGMLYVATINESIFHPGTKPLKERSLSCFYVGKSTYQDGFFDRENTFEITTTTPPKKELGTLFRSARVLYCFDNSTILAFEAAMCGCPVVIIPDGTQTREDFEGLELGMNGIAWGPAELPLAENTLPELPRVYQQVKLGFDAQLNHFIQVTAEDHSSGVEKILAAKARHESHSPLTCPHCLELEKELENLYKKVEVYERSRYLLIRSRIRERFPRLDVVLSSLANSLFVLIRSSKRTFLDGAHARKAEALYAERRKSFAEKS